MMVTKSIVLAFKWKEFIPADEWAENHYILEKDSAVGGGRFNFEFAPHMRKPLQCASDDQFNELVLWFGSQGGKTTIDMIILNHYMDRVGGNAMFFLPSDELVPFTATDRVLPAIHRTLNSEKIISEKEDRKLRDNSKNIRYSDGVIRILSSTKAANRKSTPAKLIIMDEISEMLHAHVKEISERAKTFEMFGGKIIKSSTSVNNGDPIQLGFASCEIKFEYYVKCPECGKEHIDDFIENLRIPEIDITDENLTEDEKLAKCASLASRGAYYECPHCKDKWDTEKKNKAIDLGDWKVHGDEIENGKSVGFRLSSFASKFVSIEKMAKEYILANDDEKMMLFYNGWLSKIYQPKLKTLPKDKIWELKSSTPRNVIPDDTIGLVGMVDVQKDHFYYVVLSVDFNMNPRIVDYGRIETWYDLKELILFNGFMTENQNRKFLENQNRNFPRNQNSKFPTNFIENSIFPELWAIDAGYNRQEVYNFCSEMNNLINQSDDESVRMIFEKRGGVNVEVIPIAGNARATSSGMAQPASITPIEKDIHGRLYENPMKLHTVNTYQFKDALFRVIDNSIEGRQGQKLSIHADMQDDICVSLTSEYKQETVNKSGTPVYQYVPTKTHPFNHYLDCCYYGMYLIHALDMRFRPLQRNTPTKTTTQDKYTPPVDYMDEF